MTRKTTALRLVSHRPEAHEPPGRGRGHGPGTQTTHYDSPLPPGNVRRARGCRGSARRRRRIMGGRSGTAREEARLIRRQPGTDPVPAGTGSAAASWAPWLVPRVAGPPALAVPGPWLAIRSVVQNGMANTSATRRALVSTTSHAPLPGSRSAGRPAGAPTRRCPRSRRCRCRFHRRLRGSATTRNRWRSLRNPSKSEKVDALQTEEHYRVDARPPARRVGLPHQVAPRDATSSGRGRRGCGR
jgi:hypothetical protein